MNHLDNFVFKHLVWSFFILMSASALIAGTLLSVSGCEITDKGIYKKEDNMAASNDIPQESKTFVVIWSDETSGDGAKYVVDTWTLDRTTAHRRAYQLNSANSDRTCAYVVEVDASDTGTWFKVSDDSGDGIWVETDSAFHAPCRGE